VGTLPRDDASFFPPSWVLGARCSCSVLGCGLAVAARPAPLRCLHGRSVAKQNAMPPRQPGESPPPAHAYRRQGPFPLNLILPCPFPLNLAYVVPQTTQSSPWLCPNVLKLSSNVSDAFRKVLKLSSEVSECKPLTGGPRR